MHLVLRWLAGWDLLWVTVMFLFKAVIKLSTNIGELDVLSPRLGRSHASVPLCSSGSGSLQKDSHGRYRHSSRGVRRLGLKRRLSEGPSESEGVAQSSAARRPWSLSRTSVTAVKSRAA